MHGATWLRASTGTSRPSCALEVLQTSSFDRSIEFSRALDTTKTDWIASAASSATRHHPVISYICLDRSIELSRTLNTTKTDWIASTASSRSNYPVLSYIFLNRSIENPQILDTTKPDWVASTASSRSNHPVLPSIFIDRSIENPYEFQQAANRKNCATSVWPQTMP